MALQCAARAEGSRRFFARCARRAASDRNSPLPLRSGPEVHDTTVIQELGDDPPHSSGAGTVPRSRRGGPYGKTAEASLALCPSFYRAAEVREAPGLAEDLSDGGRFTATEAIARFPWGSEPRRMRATTSARILELLPRSRSVAAWSFMVCDLWASMLEDFCPSFRRVRAESMKELGKVFSLVPRRGKFGWRRRARSLGGIPSSVVAFSPGTKPAWPRFFAWCVPHL